MIELASLSLFVIAILLLSAEGFSFFGTKSTSSTSPSAATNSSPPTTVSNQPNEFVDQSRRDLLASVVAAGVGGAAVLSSPAPALAAADCMKDCLKNCLLIAPKDKEYCTDSCISYCAQDDRTDGLSGSVSAANGEVGILGGSFGQGTVPKGEDKPPSIKLPGLDFSSDSGKKLLGY